MRVTLMVEALAPQLSGIGRYCWELARGIPSAPGISHVRYRLADAWIENPAQLLDAGGAKARRRGRWLRPAMRVLDRSALRRSIVHGPNYFLPRGVERGIITVHDLSVFRYADTHPIERVRQFERDFQSSLTRAVHLITDSEVIRREVIETFAIAEERVTAISLGYDPVFRPRGEDETESTLARLGLGHGTYALCVSTFEPRKKIASLLRAWRLLDSDLRKACPLVLAGPPGWLNDDLNREIADAQREGWLRNLGYVAEADLPILYAGARLFVYPSSYEGFGLPPLEAMASGVPVIVANQPCSREICAHAAQYVEPDDEAAFARLLAENLVNSVERQQWIDKGLQRAAEFSWKRCIAETADLYCRIGP